MQTTYVLFAQIVFVFPLKNETVRISIIEKTLKPGTTNINLKPHCILTVTSSNLCFFVSNSIK